MKAFGALYQLALADFLERTRRFQYLVVVAFTMWLGTMLVPGKNAAYVVLSIDRYRGIYNSAWLGLVFASVSTFVLMLFGFYLIKGAVQRDRETRLGEIIASTGVGKFEYVFGKTLSNAAVLCSILAILFAEAIAMQLIRGEDRTIHVFQIAVPMLVFALPVIAVVSALAVLFEVLPLLRGGLGNVAYFILWLTVMCALGPANNAGKIPNGPIDPLGFGAALNMVAPLVEKLEHTTRISSVGMAGPASPHQHYFLFHGAAYGATLLERRAMWLVVAFGIVILAALLFDRFVSSSRLRPTRHFAFVESLQMRLERI